MGDCQLSKYEKMLEEENKALRTELEDSESRFIQEAKMVRENVEMVISLKEKLAKAEQRMFSIAYEAHTMGRVYSQTGEKETPAEVVEMLKRMISNELNQAEQEDEL